MSSSIHKCENQMALNPDQKICGKSCKPSATYRLVSLTKLFVYKCLLRCNFYHNISSNDIRVITNRLDKKHLNI